MTNHVTDVLDLTAEPGPPTWRDDPDAYWAGIDRAAAAYDSPVAVIEVNALRANAADLLRRAGGTPIRLASKSIRVRELVTAVLRTPGFAGVLAYDLAEARWLAGTGVTDVLMGYPSADRHALAALCADDDAAARVSLLVDSAEQLDFVDSVVAPAARPPLRVALDLDASYISPLLGHIGVRRSPVHSPAQARALAEIVAARPGFRLVGVMSYEAQIAGMGDKVAGKPLYSRVIGAIQRRSKVELRRRRTAAIAAVREVAELEFVNGGGTGSLEFTHSDPSVTDIASGSGLFGPHLFDNYAHFTPAPAAAFGLSVVRKPTPDIATCHGGGWIASGPPGPDRLPKPVWPAGLSYEPREAAGEVQTPLRGAATLRVGDRVWFRHTKSGELCEHTDTVLLVDGDTVVGQLPTYRGEGKCFL